MKLRDEHIRSYIDDHREIGLLNLLTWKGSDIAPAWYGAYEPATRSDDRELFALADFNRAHYLFYRALIEQYVEKQGSVLDVGCGSGQRTALLARYSDTVIGIDSDLSKLGVASVVNFTQNILWICDEFVYWSRNNEAEFDYVFAIEIIEHVYLDMQANFLGELIRKVKPGGALLLTTPRDNNPKRELPHIGLWDDEIAEKHMRDFDGEIKYFNVKQLDNGGQDPWSDKDSSSHYVMIIKP